MRIRTTRPTNNPCEGALAYHVRAGSFGSIPLKTLNVVAVATFEGKLWEGEASLSLGLFINERANKEQRDALALIFSGRAAGSIGKFSKSVGELRSGEFVPIHFENTDDLPTGKPNSRIV